jgi:hypothetical protein
VTLLLLFSFAYSYAGAAAERSCPVVLTGLFSHCTCMSNRVPYLFPPSSSRLHQFVALLQHTHTTQHNTLTVLAYSLPFRGCIEPRALNNWTPLNEKSNDAESGHQ